MIVDNKFKDKIRKFYPIRAVSAGKVADNEKNKNRLCSRKHLSRYECNFIVCITGFAEITWIVTRVHFGTVFENLKYFLHSLQGGCDCSGVSSVSVIYLFYVFVFFFIVMFLYVHVCVRECLHDLENYL